VGAGRNRGGGAGRASVDDIRVARVMEHGMSVDAAGKITFPIKLEVSFKMRPPHPKP